MAVAQEGSEPLPGAGDVDGDGVANAAEYANVVETGGDVGDFAAAAIDPERDGSDVQGPGCAASGMHRPQPRAAAPQCGESLLASCRCWGW